MFVCVDSRHCDDQVGVIDVDRETERMWFGFCTNVSAATGWFREL